MVDYQIAFYITWACLLLLIVKTNFLGYDFNIVYWIMFGRRYKNWYDNKHRETFKDFLNKQLDKGKDN